MKIGAAVGLAALLVTGAGCGDGVLNENGSPYVEQAEQSLTAEWCGTPWETFTCGCPDGARYGIQICTEAWALTPCQCR